MPASLLHLTLRSLARLEAAGIPRQPRLTDPDRTLWKVFRRRLAYKDFIALLLEDGAQAFPVPFDLGAWSTPPLDTVDEDMAQLLIEESTLPPGGDYLAFLRFAARQLDRPDGGRLSDLQRIQPHERVLELPGTSGRAAAYLCQQHGDLSFDHTFTFLADDDTDRVQVGLAAVELRANPPTVLTRQALRARAEKGERFDRVIALREWTPARKLVQAMGWEQEVLWA